MELSVETASQDVHSGLGGSIFPNAAWRLVWALNSLKGPDERIRIPGHYDNVLPPSPRDIELMAALPEAADEYRSRYGVKRFLNGLEGGVELRLAEVFEPTCTICGLTSGYQGPGSKTVLPPVPAPRWISAWCQTRPPSRCSKTCAPTWIMKASMMCISPSWAARRQLAPTPMIPSWAWWWKPPGMCTGSRCSSCRWWAARAKPRLCAPPGAAGGNCRMRLPRHTGPRPQRKYAPGYVSETRPPYGAAVGGICLKGALTPTAGDAEFPGSASGRKFLARSTGSTLTGDE